jgi:arginine:ornithine antiporter/lysine permease
MIYARGPKFLVLSSLLYAPGTLLFFLARRERKEAVFRPVETIISGVVVVAAVITHVPDNSGRQPAN